MKPSEIEELLKFVFMQDFDLSPINEEKEKRMKERLVWYLTGKESSHDEC